MNMSAFEPYGRLVTELVQQAASSERALRAAVAARRIRNRVVNSIFAQLPAQSPRGLRGKEWIRDNLSR
jgi:hypothetical protein